MRTSHVSRKKVWRTFFKFILLQSALIPSNFAYPWLLLDFYVCFEFFYSFKLLF